MSANGYDGGTNLEKNIRALSIFRIFLKNENLWSLSAAIICTNHILIKNILNLTPKIHYCPIVAKKNGQ